MPSNSPLVDQRMTASVPFLQWLSRINTIAQAVISSGTTAQRPTSNLWAGRTYFDTTLGKPIWYKGPGWVDATGAAV
ncbi:MAG: hypothetical protein ACK5QX_12440 [bacterium]